MQGNSRSRRGMLGMSLTGLFSSCFVRTKGLDRRVSQAAWRCACELNGDRKLVSGTLESLIDSICRAADLRIQTAFRHNEHIDTESSSRELIDEVAEFPVTYLIDHPWGRGL